MRTSRLTAPWLRWSRRRRYVINAEVQWRTAGIILVVVFFVCSLVGVMQFLSLQEQARESVRAMIDPASQPLWHTAAAILVGALSYALILAFALAAGSVLLTNRLCGPIHVLGKCLREIEK